MAYVPLLVSVHCTGSKLAKFKSLFFRFAPFVKMGGENFLLGRLGNVKVNEQDIIEVVVSNSSICNTKLFFTGFRASPTNRFGGFLSSEKILEFQGKFLEFRRQNLKFYGET